MLVCGIRNYCKLFVFWLILLGITARLLCLGVYQFRVCGCRAGAVGVCMYLQFLCIWVLLIVMVVGGCLLRFLLDVLVVAIAMIC